MIALVYFSLFAFVALACGLYLLVARHPLNGALALVGTMLSLAGIYSLLSAPFLGVVQILTYAGAIMMLVIFVIMVLNTARDHRVPRFDRTGFVLLLAPATFCSLLLLTLRQVTPGADSSALTGSAAAIAQGLFDTSSSGAGLPILFEFVGLLLLASMVAAVLISKKKLDVREGK